MTTLPIIQEFLQQKRLAVVGVSRNPRDFSRTLFRELIRRGYDAVPVNPNVDEVEGLRCLPHVQDVYPPVDTALLLTNSSVTPSAARDCLEAGIRRVWMYRAGGKGAVDTTAVTSCAAAGMQVVDGECPFMFLSHAGFIHRAHGFCRKITGHYPS